MHEILGHDIHGQTRTIDVHVGRLRAKLGAEHKSMVDTVRGVGYMAATPPQPEWIVSAPTPRQSFPDPPRKSPRATVGGGGRFAIQAQA